MIEFKYIVPGIFLFQGQISPPDDPAWQFETAAEARMKLDQFAGFVKSIKRVRKLQVCLKHFISYPLIHLIVIYGLGIGYHAKW